MRSFKLGALRIECGHEAIVFIGQMCGNLQRIVKLSLQSKLIPRQLFDMCSQCVVPSAVGGAI